MKRIFAAVAAVAVIAAVLTASLARAEAEAVPYSYSEAYRSFDAARNTYCAISVVFRSLGDGQPLCTQVPGIQLYKTVQDSDYATFGFIGVDPTNKQIVVAFRGTQGITNWLQNLNYLKTKYTVTSSCGSGCETHRGFMNSYLSLRAQVTSAVMELLADFPDYQVLATGHSLGGALAVHAAVDLQDQLNRMSSSAKPVALYTFGAPRVGNPTFAAWTTQILSRGPHYRVTHCRDPVPHLPPMSFGFLHAPTEVFYRTEANSSMRICADSATAESEACSNDMWAIAIGDHLKYLGESTDCTCVDSTRGVRAAATDEDELDTPRMPKRLYVRLTWEYLKYRAGF